MRIAVAIFFLFWLVSETRLAIEIVVFWLVEVRQESADRKARAEIARREEKLLESYLV